MAQQTLVEWFHIEFQKRFSKETTEMYNNNQLGYEDLIEQAKEMEKRQIGLFLNWVIKHYSTETIDYMFAWVDSMGKEVTIQQILEQYYTETYTNESR
jgi:hypothetical protein